MTATIESGTMVDCLVDHVTKSKTVCDQRPMCSWNEDATEEGAKCTINAYKDRGWVFPSKPYAQFT